MKFPQDKFHEITVSSLIIFLFQNTCLNDGDVNLVQFLQEIASEQQFEVTYVDIEEKSISGELINQVYFILCIYFKKRTSKKYSIFFC